MRIRGRNELGVLRLAGNSVGLRLRILLPVAFEKKGRFHLDEGSDPLGEGCEQPGQLLVGINDVSHFPGLGGGGGGNAYITLRLSPQRAAML